MVLVDSPFKNTEARILSSASWKLYVRLVEDPYMFMMLLVDLA